MYRIYDDDYAATAVPHLDSDGKIEIFWDHPEFPGRWCARHGPYPYNEDNWGALQLFTSKSTIDVWSPYAILQIHFGILHKDIGVSDYDILRLSPEEITQIVKDDKKEEENKQPINTDNYVAVTIINDELRLISLSPDGSYNYLDGCGKYHNIIYTYTLDSLRREKAIREFESMLNDSSLKENDYQQFFEEYPEFIVDENYKEAHAQVFIEREIDGPLIPDFLLEPINDNEFCDILEIKRPSSKVFVLQRNRERFSAAVMEGVAQLRVYSEYFENKSLREKVEDKYGLSCFRPKLFLIIGRLGDIDPTTKRRLASTMPEVTIKTYDELLMRMKRVRK